MMSYERMDRLGILLDAEWETERIEQEKKQGKKPLTPVRYDVIDGFVFETRHYERHAVSKVVIELKRGMGRYATHLQGGKKCF